MAGFCVYYVLKPVDQIIIQVPVAVFLTFIIFFLWSWLVYYIPNKDTPLSGVREFALTLLLTPVWGVAIFMPVHYVIRGYLTSFGNISGLWMFQIPTNFFVLYMVSCIINKLGKIKV